MARGLTERAVIGALDEGQAGCRVVSHRGDLCSRPRGSRHRRLHGSDCPIADLTRPGSAWPYCPGAGGMGVVYAGVGADECRVAVKVVRPELAYDADFRDRFAREVSLLHRVSGRIAASARRRAVAPQEP